MSHFESSPRTKGFSEMLGVLMILMLTLTMAAMLYAFVGTVFAQSTRSIEVIDSYCMSGNASFVIRNGGNVDLNGNSLKCTPVSQSCSTPCQVPDNIPAGGAGYVIASGCSSSRSHSWNLRGPSNAVDLYVYCS